MALFRRNKTGYPVGSRLSLLEIHQYAKGWETNNFIRAFGLFEELSTEVGFAFSNNGLKSQDLLIRMKKIYDLFDKVS